MDFKVLDNLKNKLQINIYDFLDEIFKKDEIQKTMIEFNQDQLRGGFDVNGKKIITIGGNPYRAYTVKIKNLKGQPVNRVTLLDTGDFYRTFAVRILSNHYEIIADFEKEDGSILDNFTSDYDFLGLDQSSLIELVHEYILPNLYIELRKYLGI